MNRFYLIVPPTYWLSWAENASFEPEIAESIEDEIFSANVGLENDKITKFDAIIGCLQDLLIDSQFVGLQQDFCLNHCGKWIIET